MAVVEEFDYLCRLCATKTGILMGLPIFEAGDQMRNIDKKIASCLPVQVVKIMHKRCGGPVSLQSSVLRLLRPLFLIQL